MARLNKWDRKHLKNEEQYTRQIEAIYQGAVREAAAIGASIPDFSPDKPFYFADYPSTKARIEKLTKSLKSRITTVILNGIDTEWALSNAKNDEAVKSAIGTYWTGKRGAKHIVRNSKRYFQNNEPARDAFIARKKGGLNLSDRVWRYTEQFKAEIEMGLDLGLRDGLSADEMSRQLRQYLRQPDKLFRRVRDEHGQLHLSKQAAAYRPGSGVYRSSYLNARRLAATETNLAYRTSDHTRWQQLDFVVGIEIKLSNNHPAADICDTLAGRYPKDFKFTGWHPHCRCHAVSILKTEEEIAADNERIMNGEPLDGESVNKVSDIPPNFKAWIKENDDRIVRANDRRTLPYFLKDNKRFVPILDKNPLVPFTMDANSAAWLRERGYHGIDVAWSELADEFNVGAMAGFNVQKFDEDFTQIFSDVGGTITDRYLNPVRGRLSLQGICQGEGFALARTFRMEDGVKCVHHGLFEIPKGIQGQGVSKKVFQALYEQYQNAGVQRIDVFANIDVGGYTWARYGFCANRRDIERIINKRWDVGKITKSDAADALKVVEDYFDKNKSASKFPMNLLADKDYGKNLLLTTDWDGYLDLQDTKQRKVFENYLSKR